MLNMDECKTTTEHGVKPRMLNGLQVVDAVKNWENDWG